MQVLRVADNGSRLGEVGNLESQSLNFSKNLKTVDDCFYFINQSSDYDLFLDSEVETFLSKYGVEVTGNEPKGFFTLMQKINRPTQWKNKIYYICDSADFNESENDIYRSLAFYIKVDKNKFA